MGFSQSVKPFLARFGLGVWMGAVILSAFFWVPALEGQFTLKGNNARIMIFHVPAAFMSVLGFALGGWYAWRYLRFKTLADDFKSASALELAMLFGILATLSGMLFAYNEWGHAWHWDPRETSMLAQLLIYAAYFGYRGSISDQEQRARLSAGYALFALATVPFLIFLVPRIPALKSLHPADTLWTRDGLMLQYRVTLYSAFAGYAWLFARLWKLQVGVKTLESRLEELDGLEADRGAAFAPRVVRRVPVSAASGEPSERASEKS